ncbi:MAG: RHS repeat protein [Acidobacteria bacterium]|nr:RHS repeat protein [Acidobacteriota bacterium]
MTLPSVATPQEYTYDPVNLLKTLKDARGNTVASATYDASGRVLTETDAVGSTKSYTYNLALRTTTTTHPDTGVEVVEQDPQGNVVRRVDGLNRTWL